jgi:hypothetical protein
MGAGAVMNKYSVIRTTYYEIKQKNKEISKYAATSDLSD